MSQRSVSPIQDNFPDSYVDNVAFFEYTKLPGIICDRFFHLFKRTKQGNLITQDEFVKGLMSVYVSSLAKKMDLTFRMYDFGDKGHITKEEVRLLLSYVPF